MIHPLNFSGEKICSKLDRIKAQLTAAAIDAVVVSALDQIAWLFNLRGSDIDCNPCFFSFALIELNLSIVHLFVGRRQGQGEGEGEGEEGFELSDEVKEHLRSEGEGWTIEVSEPFGR